MRKYLFIVLTLLVFLTGCAGKQITPTAKLVRVHDVTWCIAKPFISFPLLGKWKDAVADKGTNSDGEDIAGVVSFSETGRYVVAVFYPTDGSSKTIVRGFDKYKSAFLDGLNKAASPDGEVIDARRFGNNAVLSHLIHSGGTRDVKIYSKMKDEDVYFITAYCGLGPEADAYAEDFIRMMEQATIH